MNKNPWIKKRKDKDEGWEFLEHGFKIRHTDRDTPMIFRPGQESFEYQPHNPNWHSLKNGTRYFLQRQDRSKDWTIRGTWEINRVESLHATCIRIGYSVPEGGIDE